MNIETIVRAILAEHVGVAPDTVFADTPVRALPAADSLKMLSVILAVENRFEIEIPDDATFRIETIGEFESLVQSLVAAKPNDFRGAAGQHPSR